MFELFDLGGCVDLFYVGVWGVGLCYLVCLCLDCVGVGFVFGDFVDGFL